MNNEVEELIWVPLSYFFNQKNRATMEVRKGKFKLGFPSYVYNKKCIWGLSLSMIDELRDINGHILNGTNIRRRLFIPPKFRGLWDHFWKLIRGLKKIKESIPVLQVPYTLSGCEMSMLMMGKWRAWMGNPFPVGAQARQPGATECHQLFFAHDLHRYPNPPYTCKRFDLKRRLHIRSGSSVG